MFSEIPSIKATPETVVNATPVMPLRRKLAAFAAVGSLLSGMTATGEIIEPTPAYASTIDDALSSYPDKNMPCEHKPYNVTGACANYDWGMTHTEAYDDSSEISERGYAYRNCTDWVAFRLRQVANFVVSKDLRDGGKWYDNAPAGGYKRSTTPRAWDAAVVPATYDAKGTMTSYGHVAFIESVDAIDTNDARNDVITISEYNHDALGSGDKRTGKIRDMGFTGFVDFGVHPSGDTSQTTSTYSTSGVNSKPKMDSNGDGNDDLLLLTHDTDGATGANVGLSTNTGLWMQPEWWHDKYTDWNSMKPFVGDVTGDGKADLTYLIPTAAGSQAWVLASLGKAYQSPQLWWPGDKYQFDGIKAGIGDVNGDGKADLMLATKQADGGTAPSPLISNGSSFSLKMPWWTDTYTDWNTMKPFVGDVTGDGTADVTYMVPTQTGTDAWVLPSTKTSLQSAQRWWKGDNYQFDGIKAVMGDVDGNGADDLLLVTKQADGGTAVSPLLSTNSSFWLQQPWWTDTYTDWNVMQPFAGNFTGARNNQHPVSDFGYMVPGAGKTNAWILPSARTKFNAPQNWWSDAWGFDGIKIARGY